MSSNDQVIAPELIRTLSRILRATFRAVSGPLRRRGYAPGYRRTWNVTTTLDRYGHLMPGNEQEAAGLLDAYVLSAART